MSVYYQFAEFPSPFGVLVLKYSNSIGNGDSHSRFRPLSGCSFLNDNIEDLGGYVADMFPSPFGVLVLKYSLYSYIVEVKSVSVPFRGARS